MTMETQPITLEGRRVRLEPLSLAHHAPMCEAGLDFDLWHWNPQNVRTPEDMRAYIEQALAEQARGTSLPFATIDQASGKVIGSTRYMNIDVSNLRVEIGSTWLAKPWQRTSANTEAKYLMLRHAFEEVRLHPRGIQNGLAEPALARRHPAAGSQRGRNAAQPHADLDGPHPAHRLFQHH